MIPTDSRPSLALALALALVLPSSAFSADSPAGKAPPPSPRSPEALGMDARVLAGLFRAAEEKGIALHSVLVSRGGESVLEAYFHPYGAETKHSIESNTKTLVAALVGAASAEGRLEGPRERFVDLFPERRGDSSKAELRLEHLLTMSSGLDDADGSPRAQAAMASGHWSDSFSGIPMKAAPGASWEYRSGDSQLLSAALTRATGMSAREYLNKKLLLPLGIPELSIEDWADAPGGDSNGVAGIYMRPRDLLRFGELLLGEGAWRGHRLLPKSWVKAMTSPRMPIGRDPYAGGRERAFGYMLSVFPKLGYYGYLGRGGQCLLVHPASGIAAVFTASLPVSGEASILDLFEAFVLGAASKGGSLPEDPAADLALAAAISRAAEGPVAKVPDLPDVAYRVSGKEYALGANPFGWEALSLSFERGSPTATAFRRGAPPLLVGLDGRCRLNDLPGSRPVGLRGAWIGPGEFVVEEIILGEFSAFRLAFRFGGDALDLEIRDSGFGGSVSIKGRRP